MKTIDESNQLDNQENQSNIPPKKTPIMSKSDVKNIFIKGMSGMVWGLFATLLVGTILTQIATICGYDVSEGAINNGFLTMIYGVGTILKSLMGFGIGMGISLAIGFNALSAICVGVGGAVATMFTNKFGEGIFFKTFFSGNNNDPVIVYIVVIAIAFLIKLIWRNKKTPFDLIIMPLFCVAVAIAVTWLFSPITTFLIGKLGDFLHWAMNGTANNAPLWQKLIFSALIGTVMGITLTAPISSAALAVSIGLNGLGAGAAVVGCCCQMVGFAIQGLRENKIGIFFSSLLGTSMIFFPNIIKKPLAWLPTIIASIILCPLATLFFEIQSNPVGAGMGTSGLVGVLQTLDVMGYSLNGWLSVGLFCLVLPAGLVFGIDLLFRKLKWIKKDDLKIVV